MLFTAQKWHGKAEEVHLTVFGVTQYPTPTNAKQKQTKTEDLQPNRKKWLFEEKKKSLVGTRDFFFFKKPGGTQSQVEHKI